jgi:hypothetical protein
MLLLRGKGEFFEDNFSASTLPGVAACASLGMDFLGSGIDSNPVMDLCR